jgi:hypothetical protein
MALSFAAKKTQVFVPVYAWIASQVKSKRAVVALISLLSGILPISGRAAISAGALDTIAPDNKKRKNYGVIDYLSTHHYYFWSPLEATVLVPMATLGLTYAGFISHIWPLLVTAVVVILYYIFVVLKEDDIEINVVKRKQAAGWQKEDRKQIISYATTLLFVGAIIILGNIVKANFETINAWVEQAHNNGLLIVVAAAGFLASFALGSSGKFAGFTALSASVFGPEYLALFFAVDYMAYMLSPAHKCLVISQSYFNTPLKQQYKAALALTVPVLLVGILVSIGLTA